MINKRKKINNHNSIYFLKLELDSHGETYEECTLEVFSLEDAMFEANELAVDFSGFTLDNWTELENNTYELQRDAGESFIITITKGD